MTSQATGSWDNTSSTSADFDIRPRKPSVAFLLSICPGLGQQYAGRLIRGILFYISLVVISWLAAVAYMYVTSPWVGILFLSVPFVGVTLIAIDAYFCARRQPKDYRLKWYNRYWIYAGVFLTLLVTVNPLMDYLVGGYIVRALYVTSDSMRPAVLKHDLVVINKLAKPSLGDIVLIKFGEKRNNRGITKLIENELLSRVIAQAGDTIEIKGRQVYLNGKPLAEDYVSFTEQASLNPLTSDDFHLEPLIVPAGAYFVLSDAREFSFDSRNFGLVDRDEISGVATKVFWSWNLDQGQFQWNRTAMSLR
jgi:signal peptidase I